MSRGARTPTAVVGSANVDFVFPCEEFPHPGQTVLGGAFAQHAGGKGANQAACIGRLGGSVRLIAKVGSDPSGEALIQTLVSSGVDTESVLRSATSTTGAAAILVGASGENMIVVAPGANAELRADEVRNALSTHPHALILAQLEVPLACVEAAAEMGELILNPAPARELPHTLYSKLLAITPNESEAHALTGILPGDEASCARVARFFLERGTKNVVITLGSKGSWWTNGERSFFADACRVAAIDTTAAGDAFNGALAWSIAQGRDWPEAIGFANRVAALSTTREGAIRSMPHADDLSAFEQSLSIGGAG